jgi:hypothetical protein
MSSCALGGSTASTTSLASGGPTTTVDEVKAPWSRPQRSHVQITVRGTVNFACVGDAALRVLTFRPQGQAEDLSLLSVGFESYSPIGKTEQFRTAFDLAGAFKGPGTYTISKGSGSVTSAAGQKPTGGVSLSDAFLVWVRLKDGTAALSKENLDLGREFNKVTKPCTIKVDDKDVHAGSLICPELTDAKGETVSLKLVWAAPKT